MAIEKVIVPYSALKVATFGKVPGYYVENEPIPYTYDVAMIGDGMLFIANLQDPVDIADFEAEHKDSLTKVGSIAEAYLLGVEANKIPLVRPRAADGSPVVAPTFLHSSNRGRLKGYRFTALAGQVTIFDIEVTHQILVQGGSFWVRNAGEDTAEFSVIDKSDVLGLHTQNGIPLGTPIELVKYAETIEFPSGDINDTILMPTVAPVAPGLFMRCTYTSRGDQDVKFGIRYQWYVGE